MLEFDYWKTATFITLTYSPENIPIRKDTKGEYQYTLKPRDMQLFMKRLREYFDRKHYGRKLRYFYCGEYGQQSTKRPHYHLVLFHTTVDDFLTFGVDRKTIKRNLCDEFWKKGNTRVEQFKAGNAKYVAGYVVKKMSDTNRRRGSYPEYVQMSRMPALGSLFLPRLVEHFSEDVSRRIPLAGLSLYQKYFLADDGEILSLRKFAFPPVIFRYQTDIHQKPVYSLIDFSKKTDDEIKHIMSRLYPIRSFNPELRTSVPMALYLDYTMQTHLRKLLYPTLDDDLNQTIVDYANDNDTEITPSWLVETLEQIPDKYLADDVGQTSNDFIKGKHTLKSAVEWLNSGASPDVSFRIDEYVSQNSEDILEFLDSDDFIQLEKRMNKLEWLTKRASSKL